MNARITWLGASLATLLIGAAHLMLPASTVALRTTELLGAESALAAAGSGRAALMQALLTAEFVAAAPWLLLGTCLALLLRMGLRRWQRGTQPRRSMPVVDAAGVALELQGAALDHVPAHDWLPLAPMPATQMPRGATELERQAFAALAAAPTLRAGDGLTVLQRTRCRYDDAVRQHGAGSLAAIAAAACELGELLAHQHRDGRWTEVHPCGAHLTTLALTRLPAYWHLGVAERATIAALLDCLCTQQAPLQPEPELGAALQALRRDSVRIVAIRDVDTSSFDDSVLRAALRELPAQLSAWNINGRLRASAPIEGWWLPERNALLLPTLRLRAWLARRMDAGTVGSLNLAQPAIGPHSTDRLIAAALQAEALLARKEDGSAHCNWWRARIGGNDAIVAALDGARIDAALRVRWGSVGRRVMLEPV